MGLGVDYLEHSAARIVAQYIYDTMLTMTDPLDSGSWPLYVGFLPDGYDIGAIFDTSGITETRDMRGGLCTHYGLQIRLKGRGYHATWAKMNDIIDGFRNVKYATATISSGVSYIVVAVTQTSSIVSLGLVNDTKDIFDFSVNFIVTLSNSS